MMPYEERERVRGRATGRLARWFGLAPAPDVLRLLDELEAEPQRISDEWHDAYIWIDDQRAAAQARYYRQAKKALRDVVDLRALRRNLTAAQQATATLREDLAHAENRARTAEGERDVWRLAAANPGLISGAVRETVTQVFSALGPAAPGDAIVLRRNLMAAQRELAGLETAYDQTQGDWNELALHLARQGFAYQPPESQREYALRYITSMENSLRDAKAAYSLWREGDRDAPPESDTASQPGYPQRPHRALLDKWRHLADAATPGPWDHLYSDQCCSGGCIDPVLHDIGGTSDANAQFIAAARDAVPALLDALAEAESQRAAWARRAFEAETQLPLEVYRAGREIEVWAESDEAGPPGADPLKEEGGSTPGDPGRRTQATPTSAEATLAAIRTALAQHPRCDIHPDDDPISCGWKSAVASVQWALDTQGDENT